MFNKPFRLTLLFFALAVTKILAQGAVDSTGYATNTQGAIDIYSSGIGEQSEIYNGEIYNIRPVATKGSPYFLDAAFTVPGMIRYNGTLYKNVPLLYDIFANQMVAAQRNVFFVLRADKLSDAYFSGHHFINLVNQTGKLSPGYYDELYEGRSQVLVKRAREVKRLAATQTVEVSYFNSDVIYIRKAGAYFEVDGKGSVLSLFKDKKKELNQFLKDKGVRYGDNREASIVLLANYYDQLTK